MGIRRGRLATTTTKPKMANTMTMTTIDERLILCLLLLQNVVVSVVGNGGPFASCRQRLGENDANSDQVLSETDFRDFVFDLSESKIVLDIASSERTAIHQAYDVRVDESLGGIDVSQEAAPAGDDTEGDSGFTLLDQFCENVYQSFFPFFGATVNADSCDAAIAIATAFDHTISQSDFVSLVNNLLSSKEGGFLVYSDLGSAVQEVFTDFQNNDDGDDSSSALGVIDNSLLESRIGLSNFFCRRVILGTQLDDPDYLPIVPGTVTDAPTTTPTYLPTAMQIVAQQEFITDEQYGTCTRNMGLNDRNRDFQLDRQEYIGYLNSFTSAAFAGMTITDLPPIFQNLYLSGEDDEDGTINILGWREWHDATAAQFRFVRNFCIDTFFALSQWGGGPETDEPTAAPTPRNTGPPRTSPPTRFTPPTSPQPTAPSPTPPPTIPDSIFYVCTLQLHLADVKGTENARLTGNEYVTYLNTLLDNRYLFVPFDDIDQIFRNTYANLADGSGTINIAGAKSDPPRTTAQSKTLRRICTLTAQAVETFRATTDAPSPPPVPLPTLVPTQRPTTETTVDPPDEFEVCRAALRGTDTDGDNALTAQEYVQFLGLLIGDDASRSTFDELDAILKLPFDAFKGVGDLVNIVAARPENDPSIAQLSSLRSFCRSVYNAVEEAANPGVIPTQPPTQSPTRISSDPVENSCLTVLQGADLNSDGSLDQSEYTELTKDLATVPPAANPTFAQLPYVLRENFDWIADGSARVNIGLVNQARRGQLARLSRICRRTNETVASAASGNSEVALLDHCLASFAEGDQNDDSILSEGDFRTTVDYFLGQKDPPGGFDALEEAFQNYFSINRGSFNGINVDGSKPNDSPTAGQKLLLDFLCVELEMASNRARVSYNLWTNCLDAVSHANVNEDNLLSDNEYANFVHFLAGRRAENQLFANLPQGLQANFATLRGSSGSINVEGWNTDVVTPGQRGGLETICSATRDLLNLLPSAPPTVAPSGGSGGPTTLTIYNGFMVGNKEGVEADSLRNADNRALNEAYTAFVNKTVADQTGRRRLRGRKLVVQGVSLETVSIGRIINRECPASYEGENARCQDAYGSFDLILTDDQDIDEIEDQYTNSTQRAIADGDLQAQLDVVSPDSRLEIVGASESTKPSDEDEAPTSSPTAAPSQRGGTTSRDDSGSGSTIVIVTIVVILLGRAVAGCFVFRSILKKNAQQKELSQKQRKQQQGLVGEFPQESAYTEGNDSIYDDIVPPPVANTLLPDGSDHSHEVNFGFNAPHPDQEQPAHYSGYGKTSLETVGEADNEDPSTNASEWEGNEANPWGATDTSSDMLNASVSDSEGEGSMYLVDKQSPYRADKGQAPMNYSRSNLSRSGSGYSGSGFSQQGSGDLSQNSNMSNTMQMMAQSASQNADTDEEDQERYEDEHEQEYEEQPTFQEQEFDEQGMYEEGQDSQSQFGGGPQFDESSEQSEFMDEGSARQGIDEDSYMSQGSGEHRTHEDYREEIEALVHKVVPDEIENIDAMIAQFVGREEELIATLRSMAEQGAHITGESSEEEDDTYEEEEVDDESFEDEVVEDEAVSHDDGENDDEEVFEDESGVHEEDVTESEYEEEGEEESYEDGDEATSRDGDEESYEEGESVDRGEDDETEGEYTEGGEDETVGEYTEGGEEDEYTEGEYTEAGEDETEGEYTEGGEEASEYESGEEEEASRHPKQARKAAAQMPSQSSSSKKKSAFDSESDSDDSSFDSDFDPEE